MTFHIINKQRIAEQIEENDGLKEPPIAKLDKDGRLDITDKDVERQVQYDAERQRRGLVHNEEKEQWKRMGYKPDA